MASSGTDMIGFSITFPEPFGSGTVRSTESPLFRPFRDMVNLGRPVGKINYLFTDAEGFPTHVLGSLCYTPGERLLFYPGMRDRKPLWRFDSSSGLLEIGGPDRFVDHLTLEKDMKFWHITLLTSEGSKCVRIPKYRTRQLSDEMIFWFGLSVRNVGILEQTPSSLQVEFQAPSSDSTRRVDEMVLAREGSEFHLVSLPEEEMRMEGSFLHYDFFVGKKGSNWEEIKSFTSVPRIPPSTKKPLQINGRWRQRIHPTGIPTFPHSLYVCASQWKGILENDSIVTSAE